MLARVSIIFGALIMASQSANAAPQILGLLATKVPQALVCSGGECSADLASFCLQPKRGEPWPGHPYRVANEDNIALVVQTADGGTRIFKAKSHVRFKANIAMTAVRAYVDRNFLDSLGAGKFSLQVNAGAALLPVATQGDPDPITADEIAAATGPNRVMGAAFFDNGAPVGVVARLTAALLSQTPQLGKMTKDARRRLWTDAIGTDLERMSTPDGIFKARTHLDACHLALAEGTHHSMRSCLEFQHETFMRKQNEKLRRALKAGW